MDQHKEPTEIELLHALNNVMGASETLGRAKGRAPDVIYDQLARVSFQGNSFGEVIVIATRAARLGLEPLTKVATIALDKLTFPSGAHS